MARAGSERRRPRRRGLVIAAAVLALLLLPLGFAVYRMYPAFAPPPSLDFPPPAEPGDRYRQDVAQLRLLLDIDRSFSPPARRAFTRALDDLEARASSLDDAAFEMAASRAVALAGNGHTNIRGVAYGLSLNALPLRVAWFPEGLFVLAAHPDHADLLGARVVSIGGRDPESLVTALRPYVGGPPSHLRERSSFLLTSPQALHAAGLLASPAAADLVLEHRDGRRTVRRIAAAGEPANGRRGNAARRDPREHRTAKRDLSPVRWPGDARPWVHVLDARSGALPLYLRQPDRPYWRATAPGTGALYVQINRTMNAPEGQTLGGFLRDTLEEVETTKPRAVVVDLRFNGGGDYTLTADFSRSLPGALGPQGRIFILTSGNTFSAGLITAARLKHFAGPRGVIVGEPMGDDARFWAEGSRLALPNTGLSVVYATAYHDWESGCGLAEILKCYLPNYVLGRGAGDLSPQIRAPITFPDYLDGRDTALEAVAYSLANSAPTRAQPRSAAAAS